ncbi:MAG: M23 family metallopeptidase [Saprospiraceae bacterium]
MNRDTFEEKYSLDLNLQSFYILVSSIFVFMFLLFYLLIAYTPVKQLIPGYGNIKNNTYVIKLNKQLADLEERIEAQDALNKALKQMLVSDDSDAKIKEELAKFNQYENNTEGDSDGKNNSHNMTEMVDKSNDSYMAPLQGKINRKPEINLGHYGLDIAGYKDNPIKSIAAGNVIFADWATDTGYTIIVQHRNGLISIYMHNSALLKETGDFVKAGEAIAILGNTGLLTSGPHLHLEIWDKGIPKDPLDYFKVEI